MRKDIVPVDQIDEVISDPFRVIVELQIVCSGSTGQLILIQSCDVDVGHMTGQSINVCFKLSDIFGELSFSVFIGFHYKQIELVDELSHGFHFRKQLR